MREVNKTNPFYNLHGLWRYLLFAGALGMIDTTTCMHARFHANFTMNLQGVFMELSSQLEKILCSYHRWQTFKRIKQTNLWHNLKPAKLQICVFSLG